MQMTEDLIRNVVQQVLTQMGGPRGPAQRRRNGRRQGVRRRSDGVYPDRSTRRSRRPKPPSRRSATGRWPTARRPSPASSDICVEQAEELGRHGAGGDEDRPARSQDRQAPRDDPARSRGSSTSAPSSTRGDGGLTLTDYAPFGVIGAITPVTHSLPTLAGNAINMLASGQHGRRSTPTRRARTSPPRASGGSTRRSREAIGLDDLLTIIDPPTLEIGRRACSITATSSCWSSPAARRWPGRPWQASGGRSSPAPATRRSSSTDRLPGQRGGLDRLRGRLRQQPALHRREAGLRRRRDLRQADGGGRPTRRLPALGRRRSTP